MNIDSSIKKAFKWSTITEISVKIITPILNMVLARILTPSIFGIVALITMILSFAEVIADAGFNKYIVQSEFQHDDDLIKTYSVAFWANLALSLLLALLIVILRNPLSSLLGNPELGLVLALASLQVPLFGLSSTFYSIYVRFFEFKKLFFIRISTALLSPIITITLALLGFEHWSLIIGSIISLSLYSGILFWQTAMRPRLFFNFKLLYEMVSFSVYTTIDSVLLWLNSWIDVLLISSVFTEHLIGIYRNGISTANSFLAIIQVSVTNVLFSSLSRLKNDSEKFNKLLFQTQRIIALIGFPLGVGIFLYRDLATKILFGRGWDEAAIVIGIWTLFGFIIMVYSNTIMVAIKAKGKPIIPMISRLILIVVSVAGMYLFISRPFDEFVVIRGILSLLVIVNASVISIFFLKVSFGRTVYVTLPSLLGVAVMVSFNLLIPDAQNNYLLSFLFIFASALVYFSVILAFKHERNLILDIIKKANRRIKKKQ